MSGITLLTAEEVAAKLKVHIKTVYANCDLPRVEFAPGTIRFDEAAVDAYIRSRTTRKPKPVKRVMRRSGNVVDLNGRQLTDTEAG